MIRKVVSRSIFLLIVSLNFLSCGKNPSDQNKEDYSQAFEKVWTDFDENYSYFLHKSIDWDAIKSKYSPKVQSPITYDYFIENVLQDMLTELRDLHVQLFDASGQRIELYSRPGAFNYNYDGHFFATYLNAGISYSAQKMFLFSSIHDSIGYVRIASWNTELSSDLSDFTSWFEKQKDLSAMIVDVRNNPGGNDGLATQVAQRFADQTRLYEYAIIKTGPAHNDLSVPYPREISPAGSWQFAKPVVVLIGNVCMSSNESFILMMDSFPHVTTIGDTTRGSSANPQPFELEDGTKYYISSWIACKLDKTPFEDVGLFPDIPIDASESIIDEHDLVLERAIEFLISH